MAGATDSRVGTSRPPRLPVLLVAAAIAACSAAPVSAATFSISPTQLVLSGRTSSALLTVRNDSTETLQFQLSAFAWQQGPKGEILTTPTSDIVFFPALFTLAPGEERRVRVGRPVPVATAVEQTYRLFIEELPPPGSAKPAGVRVLTRMGVPIFLRPTTERASATLAGLRIRTGTASFTLSNTGAVHFIPRRIVVRGVGAAGDSVFEEEVPGWYVLAGGHRDFEVALPAAVCEGIRFLQVEAELPFATLTERIATAPGACAP